MVNLGLQMVLLKSSIILVYDLLEISPKTTATLKEFSFCMPTETLPQCK